MHTKYRKFKNPQYHRLAYSIICDKWDSNDDKIIKEKRSFEILKHFGLINNVIN